MDAKTLAELADANSLNWDAFSLRKLYEAADLIEQQAAEIERLTAELELRRKSGSASERLHNLCEGLAKDADGSEWSREEWERLDAEMLQLKNDNKMFCSVQLRMQNLVSEQAAEIGRLKADAALMHEDYVTQTKCIADQHDEIARLKAERDALLGALADIAFSGDMTLLLAKLKARRVYVAARKDAKL